MTGWKIHSGDGTAPPECPLLASQVFTFPGGYSLAAGASVRVHSGPDASNNPPGDLFWTTAYIWNNDGDRAELRNASGQVIDVETYGACD